MNLKHLFPTILFGYLLLTSLTCRSQSADFVITNLTCELTDNPVAVTEDSPRLGWQLSSTMRNVLQKAYRVKVYSRNAVTNGEEADVWDSGKVTSSRSQYIDYDGEALQEGETYYWKVRVWDNKGNPSEWSEISQWKMALDRGDLDASWIGAIKKEHANLPEGRKIHAPSLSEEARQEIRDSVHPLATRSIMLRKPFSTEKGIKNAKVYISGLGHYELSINGEKIGDSEFAPLWTDYDKTVYYNSYDVKDKLKEGDNAIGVVLGNGMYNVIESRFSYFYVSFGPPTLFFKMKIEYNDGTVKEVNSDGSWKYSKSPIVYNSIFGGEDHDATLEQEGWDSSGFDDNSWKEVILQEAPKGELRPQQAAPVKIMKEHRIVETMEPKPGLYVFDMGQNLSGFPTIRVKGKRGDKIRLYPGENLKDDGTVEQYRTGGPHFYEYTLKGEGKEEWQPKFSYYGYQYVQVEKVNLKVTADNNLPTLLDLKSNFVYNSSGSNGSFECSNEIFNQTHDLINKAIRSNFHSVFTDCPHREKLGWLEETHLNGPGLFYNYNLQTFIPKVMQDIRDAQRKSGLIPTIAPEYIKFGGDFTDSPEWGVAGIVLPWMYYEYYGDRSLIEENYEVMKNYVGYLSSTAENNIVSHGLGDWDDYGDHPPGYSKNSPIALSSTSHYFFGTELVAKAAKLLGKKDDQETYEALAEEIRTSFNDEFFNEATNQYGTSSQFSNAVPIFMGIVEPEDKKAVMENLLKDIKERGYRLTTGDVGNRYLYQTLARNGQNEVMYKMHNHYDVPGYGFQIKYGLTTLSELWDPSRSGSWNHFMMGQIEEWFYRSLAGIVPDEGNPGFKHFFLQPEIVGDMSYVKASYNSIYGKIISEWEIKNGKLHLIFQIPANTTATVNLPVKKNSEIKINSSILEKSGLVIENFPKSDGPSFKLGSGVYQIECDL